MSSKMPSFLVGGDSLTGVLATLPVGTTIPEQTHDDSGVGFRAGG